MAYTAAKRGQVGVSQNLREELRQKNSKGSVVVICPGLVRGTNMVKELEQKNDEKRTPLPVAVELIARVVENPTGHDEFLYLLENGELTEIEPAKHIRNQG